MAPPASHAWRWVAAGAAVLLAAMLVLAFRTLTGPAMPSGASGSEQLLRTGAMLVQSNYCLRCHGMARVGPDFAQIAQRYRGDASAPAQLAERIQHGSAGRWGRKLMPRQPNIGPEEAQLLAAWVLAQPDPVKP
jgi:cytochrome c